MSKKYAVVEGPGAVFTIRPYDGIGAYIELHDLDLAGYEAVEALWVLWQRRFEACLTREREPQP